MKKRLYQLDNIKFFLIFLVIFGHLLEAVPGQISYELYRTIYLFHMPAFIFLSGCFASFHPSKIRVNLILPYFVFQTFYLVFQGLILNQTASFSLSYTTPFWLLWYIFAIAVYEIFIPFIDVETRRQKMLIFAGSIIVSLLAGYDDTIGRYLSLSRILTFAPYFICGYYCKTDFFQRKFRKYIYILSITVCLAGIVYTHYSDVTPAVLYGTNSYATAEYTPLLKLFLLFIGFSGVFLLRVIPEKKIPVISEIGTNTKAIYLLHGFVILCVKKYLSFDFSSSINWGLCLLLTLCLLLCFGNRFIGRPFHFPPIAKKRIE